MSRLKNREQGTGNRDQGISRSISNYGCPILSRFLRKGGRPLLLAALSGVLFAVGCRQDMQNEPKMIPQRGSSFFADHRGARAQVLDTVARGQMHEDSYFYTGLVQGANGYKQEQDLMPFQVNMEVL